MSLPSIGQFQATCPECRVEKHHNCADFAFDMEDRRCPCMCDCDYATRGREEAAKANPPAPPVFTLLTVADGREPQVGDLLCLDHHCSRHALGERTVFPIEKVESLGEARHSKRIIVTRCDGYAMARFAPPVLTPARHVTAAEWESRPQAQIDIAMRAGQMSISVVDEQPARTVWLRVGGVITDELEEHR